MVYHKDPFLARYYSNSISMTFQVYQIHYFAYYSPMTPTFSGVEKTNNLMNTLHVELSKLYTWLLANKLTLNISKTHIMVFHRAKHKKYKIVIEINNVPIEQVRHTKFLGLIFDDNLDWSNHISYLNTKIAKGIGIICRAKHIFLLQH